MFDLTSSPLNIVVLYEMVYIEIQKKYKNNENR